MLNSIQRFIEKETYEIEKVMREFVEGTIDIDSYGEDLKERSLNLAREMIAETLELMDQTIKNSSQRKADYRIEQNGQEKELLLPLGPVRFRRTCYTSKKSGKSIYLLDEVIGLEPHQRLTLASEAAIIEEALESSYQKGGRRVSLTEYVSKQTVKNVIHGTVIEMPVKEREEKKQIRYLHIDADEDHVSAQFWEKKGDLKTKGNGRKANTLMPKLVCVYEDIIEESGEASKSKRYKLTGKHYFCGLYKGKENERLWEEVRDYIAATYDMEYLETIYLSGDGAAWIKAGCEELENTTFVLDKFHMEKYINRSVTHLLDSAGEIKEEIYDCIGRKDKAGLREVYGRILKVTKEGNKYTEVEESRRYLLNNWSGIEAQSEPGASFGCHAEGQVSHVLSSRMSSRPMGWSEKGADQMSRLRAYRMNEGKIIDLLKYQKQKQIREERIEKKEELVKELRRAQAGRKYAQQLQGTVPGIGSHEMKWMRDLLGKKPLCG